MLQPKLTILQASDFERMLQPFIQGLRVERKTQVELQRVAAVFLEGLVRNKKLSGYTISVTDGPREVHFSFELVHSTLLSPVHFSFTKPRL